MAQIYTLSHYRNVKLNENYSDDYKSGYNFIFDQFYIEKEIFLEHFEDGEARLLKWVEDTKNTMYKALQKDRHHHIVGKYNAIYRISNSITARELAKTMWESNNPSEGLAQA